MIPPHLKKYNPKYFDRGKRSLIYKFKKNSKVYIIKSKHPASKAINRLQNEAKYLKILNKHSIGPKLIESGKDYIVYEFVKGKFIKDIKLTKHIIKQVLNQCRILDKLKINKKEMHHPVKHVLIHNKKITMIDFERCYKTKKPKNVTQFIEFLLRKNYKINIKLIKQYKTSLKETAYKKIINSIST